MAQPDFQFTAAGNTAVVLPASGQPGNLAHHRGAVRFRLAAAADAVRRITTPHLVANGTNAVFDVLVDDRETLITVTTGSVVLSTSTGLNYASLTAGAAARVGDQTLGRLEIQPAAGMPFRASAELGTATIAVDAAAPKGAAKARHATPPMTATRSMTVAENAARYVEPTGASASKLAAILPAGRPRNPPREPRLERGSTEDPFAVVPERPDQPSFIPVASRSHVKPEVDGSARSGPPGNAFDRLTDGLLDDLPTASTSPKRGS
jgi:hypothetical protein